MTERFDRVSGLLNLVRWQGRGLRGEYSAGRGLLEACFTAIEVGVPDDFTSTGLCILETTVKRIGASVATVYSDFPGLFDYQREVEAANQGELDLVRRRLEGIERRPEDVLLMGDPAVLLGLFGSLGAFRAQTWTVGLPGAAADNGGSATEMLVTA